MSERVTYWIHFTLSDGSEDKVQVSGDTIEEIRQAAEHEVSKRGGFDPWAEVVS